MSHVICLYKAAENNLEMKDASIVLSEALICRNHSVQQLLIHCQAGDGSQQPAVTFQQQIHELYKHKALQLSHIKVPRVILQHGTNSTRDLFVGLRITLSYGC